MHIFAFYSYFYLIRHPIEWLVSLGISSLIWVYASWMQDRARRKQEQESLENALEENAAFQKDQNEQVRKKQIAKVESLASELRGLFLKEGLNASSAHVAFDERNWPFLQVATPDAERQRAEALAKKFLGPEASMKLS